MALTSRMLRGSECMAPIVNTKKISGKHCPSQGPLPPALPPPSCTWSSAGQPVSRSAGQPVSRSAGQPVSQSAISPWTMWTMWTMQLQAGILYIVWTMWTMRLCGPCGPCAIKYRLTVRGYWAWTMWTIGRWTMVHKKPFRINNLRPMFFAWSTNNPLESTT